MIGSALKQISEIVKSMINLGNFSIKVKSISFSENIKHIYLDCFSKYLVY